MQLDKSMILDFMKKQNQSDEQVAEADRDLPDTVDTDQDKGKLEQYGIDFDKLVGYLPDNIAKSVGDLGSKFGL